MVEESTNQLSLLWGALRSRAAGKSDFRKVAEYFAQVLGVPIASEDANDRYSRGQAYIVDLSIVGIQDLELALLFVNPAYNSEADAVKTISEMVACRDLLASPGTFAFCINTPALPGDARQFSCEAHVANDIVRLNVPDLSNSIDPISCVFASVRTQIPHALPCPYNTQAVARGLLFSGRTTEVRKLTSVLSQSFVVSGGRRIGKSSVVGQAIERLERQGKTVHAFDCLTWGDLDDCIARLIKALSPEIYSEWLAAAATTRPMKMRQLQDKLLSLNVADGPSLFFFDEADRIIEADMALDWKFFRLIAVLIRNRIIRVVFAGFRSIAKLSRSDSTPLYNKVTNLNLLPLDKSDSKRLITLPFRLYEISVADEPTFANEAYVASGGFPYMLQHFGEMLFELASTRTPSRITVEDLHAVVNAEETADKALHHLLDNTQAGDQPELFERLFCALLANQCGRDVNWARKWGMQDFINAAAQAGHDISFQDADTILRRLCHSAVLRRSSQLYRFTFPIAPKTLKSRVPDDAQLVEALISKSAL